LIFHDICNPIEILSDPLLFFTVTPKPADSASGIEQKNLWEKKS